MALLMWTPTMEQQQRFVSVLMMIASLAVCASCMATYLRLDDQSTTTIEDLVLSNGTNFTISWANTSSHSSMLDGGAVVNTSMLVIVNALVSEGSTLSINISSMFTIGKQPTEGVSYYPPLLVQVVVENITVAETSSLRIVGVPDDALVGFGKASLSDAQRGMIPSLSLTVSKATVDERSSLTFDPAGFPGNSTHITLHALRTSLAEASLPSLPSNQETAGPAQLFFRNLFLFHSSTCSMIDVRLESNVSTLLMFTARLSLFNASSLVVSNCSFRRIASSSDSSAAVAVLFFDSDVQISTRSSVKWTEVDVVSEAISTSCTSFLLHTVIVTLSTESSWDFNHVRMSATSSANAHNLVGNLTSMYVAESFFGITNSVLTVAATGRDLLGQESVAYTNLLFVGPSSTVYLASRGAVWTVSGSTLSAHAPNSSHVIVQNVHFSNDVYVVIADGATLALEYLTLNCSALSGDVANIRVDRNSFFVVTNAGVLDVNFNSFIASASSESELAIVHNVALISAEVALQSSCDFVFRSCSYYASAVSADTSAASRNVYVVNTSMSVASGSTIAWKDSTMLCTASASCHNLLLQGVDVSVETSSTLQLALRCSLEAATFGTSLTGAMGNIAFMARTEVEVNFGAMMVVGSEGASLTAVSSGVSAANIYFSSAVLRMQNGGYIHTDGSFWNVTCGAPQWCSAWRISDASVWIAVGRGAIFALSNVVAAATSLASATTVFSMKDSLLELHEDAVFSIARCNWTATTTTVFALNTTAIVIESGGLLLQHRGGWRVFASHLSVSAVGGSVCSVIRFRSVALRLHNDSALNVTTSELRSECRRGTASNFEMLPAPLNAHLMANIVIHNCFLSAISAEGTARNVFFASSDVNVSDSSGIRILNSTLNATSYTQAVNLYFDCFARFSNFSSLVVGESALTAANSDHRGVDAGATNIRIGNQDANVVGSSGFLIVASTLAVPSGVAVVANVLWTSASMRITDSSVVNIEGSTLFVQCSPSTSGGGFCAFVSNIRTDATSKLSILRDSAFFVSHCVMSVRVLGVMSISPFERSSNTALAWLEVADQSSVRLLLNDLRATSSNTSAVSGVVWSASNGSVVDVSGCMLTVDTILTGQPLLVPFFVIVTSLELGGPEPSQLKLQSNAFVSSFNGVANPLSAIYHPLVWFPPRITSCTNGCLMLFDCSNTNLGQLLSNLQLAYLLRNAPLPDQTTIARAVYNGVAQRYCTRTASLDASSTRLPSSTMRTQSASFSKTWSVTFSVSRTLSGSVSGSCSSVSSSASVGTPSTSAGATSSVDRVSLTKSSSPSLSFVAARIETMSKTRQSTSTSQSVSRASSSSTNPRRSLSLTDITLTPLRQESASARISTSGTGRMTHSFGNETVSSSIRTGRRTHSFSLSLERLTRSSAASPSLSVAPVAARPPPTAANPLSLVAASGVSSLVTSVIIPTAGFAMRRTTLLATSTPCKMVANVEDALSTTIAFPDAPLGLLLGPDVGAPHRGAVIGNIIVSAATVAAGGVLTLVVHFIATKASERRTFAFSAGKLRLPGLFIIVVILLLQQTVVSSVLLVSAGSTVSTAEGWRVRDVAIGSCGLLLVAVLLGALLNVLDPRRRHFAAYSEELYERIVFSDVRSPLDAIDWLGEVRTLWYERPNHVKGSKGTKVRRRRRRGLQNNDSFQEEQNGFVQRYGFLFEACTTHRHWWLLYELCVTCALSAIAGIVPASVAACMAKLWLTVGICLASFFLFLYLHPMHSRLETSIGTIANALQVVVAVCTALGSDDAAAIVGTVGSGISALLVLLAVLVVLRRRWSDLANRSFGDRLHSGLSAAKAAVESGGRRAAKLRLAIPIPSISSPLRLIHPMQKRREEDQRCIDGDARCVLRKERVDTSATSAEGLAPPLLSHETETVSKRLAALISLICRRQGAIQQKGCAL